MILNYITIGTYGKKRLADLWNKLQTAYNCHYFHLCKHITATLAAAYHNPFINRACCGLLGTDALVVRCPQRY